VNDPAIAGIALAVLAEMRWAIARLNRRVGDLEMSKQDKPASRARKVVGHLPAVLFLLGALFLASGCTDAQIARAEAAADRAEVILAQAQATVRAAQDAIAAAKAQPGATEAMTKAQASLDVAVAALPALQATATATRDAAEAAKAAQAAGSSWWQTATAILGTLVLAAGAVAVSIARTAEATRAMRQTVSGLDDARDKLGEDRWKAAVAPALDSAQDASTKRVVRTIQAAA